MVSPWLRQTSHRNIAISNRFYFKDSAALGDVVAIKREVGEGMGCKNILQQLQVQITSHNASLTKKRKSFQAR